MSIPTTVYKTHATGNDFIVYADPEGKYDPTDVEVRVLCNRHFGVGADGLIRLAAVKDVPDLDEQTLQLFAEEQVEWFMDYRNADGSLAEMCGNGTRAVTLFAQHQGLISLSEGESVKLGTRAGVKTLTYLGDVEPCGKNTFRVDMGGWGRGELDAYAVTIPGSEGAARGTFVDMGNPHVVAVISEESSTLPAMDMLNLRVKPLVSPTIETDQNVEFVSIDEIDGANSRGIATMRVNERGVGETLSCGTGLCATGIVLQAKTGIDHWTIVMRGGTLLVDVSDDDVTLTGSAMMVSKVELL